MTKTLKILALAVAVAVMFTIASTASRADDINFSGAMAFAGQGCTAGACASQNVTFGANTTVSSTNPSPDSLVGAAVSLPSFNLSLSGSNPVFSPASGAISINAGDTNGAGDLAGTISWMDIVPGGTPGAYNVNVGLNGITGTSGTSSVLDAFLSSGHASGLVTFQFTVDNATSVQQLVTADTATAFNTSESGSVTTPEPASLLLFGTGLLGFAFLLRRKVLAA